MDTKYASSYRELYERHWWWRARERFVLAAIRRYTGLCKVGKILDVGCGDGLFFDELADFGEVQGVESDASVVTERYRHQIHLGPFDDSYQPGNRYSLILMLDVLEHISDPRGALRHAVELLEPDGIVIITVPAFRLLWTSHDILNHHFTRYTKHTFSQVAQQAGLRIIRSQYFFNSLFGAKIVLRALERLLGSQPRPPRLPRGWLNQLLFVGARMEQRLVTPLGIPFGSSLLVVGRGPRDQVMCEGR